MVVPPCLSVTVACWDMADQLTYPRLGIVSVGDMIGRTCVVKYTYPSSPCFLTPTTRIEYTPRCDIKTEELKRNILVRVKYRLGEQYYVYPKKAWNIVRDRLLDPLSKGGIPQENGILLHGPPGTGKTSMISIIADTLSLKTFYIDPSKILSKWVGESEQNFERLLDAAQASEPSIVIMDDAEWLIQRRSSVVESTPDHPTMLGLLTLLFRRLQEWSKDGRRVIGAAATNVSLSMIDPALIRSGRLGKPVFIGLPDLEAVETIFELYEVPKDKIKEWAIKVVSMGLSMADAVQIAKSLKAGKEPVISPSEGRGYVRAVPPILNADVVNALRGLRRVIPPFVFKSVRARIYVGMPSPIAEALVVTYAALVAGVPSIVLTDVRKIVEAVSTAAVTDAVLLVSTEITPPDYLALVSSMNVPVVFIGTVVPQVPHVALMDVARVNHALGYRANEVLARVVCQYYGIEVDEESLKRISSYSDNDVVGILEDVALMAASSRERVSLRDVLKIRGV